MFVGVGDWSGWTSAGFEWKVVLMLGMFVSDAVCSWDDPLGSVCETYGKLSAHPDNVNIV